MPPKKIQFHLPSASSRVPRPPASDSNAGGNQGSDLDQDYTQTRSKDILRLTSTNYETRTSHVKDFLYSIDAESLFEKSILIDGEEQTGKCSDDEAPNKARRAAWAVISKSLDSETYSRIMPDLDKGDIEELFRRVRVVYYPTHVSSVQSLYEQLRTTKLSDFKDVDLYLKSLKLLFQRLCDQGEVVPEGMCISYILGGLPKPEYNSFMLYSSSAKTVREYTTRLLEYARNEPSIPGSLHPQARMAMSHHAHTARDKSKSDKGKGKGKGKGSDNSESQEDCRKFAAGKCRNGDNCPYRHTQPPIQTPAPTPQQAQSRKCGHCKKEGHTQETCFQLRPDLLAKFKQDRASHDQANAVPSAGPPGGAALSAMNRLPSSFELFSLADSAFSARDVAFPCSEPASITEQALASPSSPSSGFSVCLDSGCNSPIHTTTAGLSNLRSPPYPLNVRVGNKIDIRCHTVGDFDGHVLVNGTLRPIHLAAVRHIPTFGINLHPISLYEKIVFQGAVATATNRGNAVFQATRQPDGMFCATLLPASTVSPTTDHSHFSYDKDIALYCTVVSSDVEHCNQCSSYDHAYVSRAYSEGISDLRLWHERLGHLHLAAISRLLGIPLPPKPFFCKGCVAGKSVRKSFKHLEWASHFVAPRAAHTFHSDVAGPYIAPIDGYVNTIFFVCGFSRFVFIRMVKATSDYTPAWIDLVNRQEANAGSTRVVAVLHSDGAKYMDSLELRAFNAGRGIVHHTSPANTPELNGVAEVTIRIVFEMARTMCIHGGVPSYLHGDAQTYATFILNHLPRTGESKTRKELFTGKSEANPLKHFRILFCSVWVQDVHPGIKPAVSKIAPRSIEYLFCGISEDGYIVRSLLDFKLRHQAVLHCVFDETSFPCRTRFNQGAEFSDPSPTGTVPLSSRELALLPMANSAGPGQAFVSVEPTLQSSLVSSHREIAAAADLTTDFSTFDAPPSMWAALNAGPTDNRKVWLKALHDELECHTKFRTLTPPLRKEDLPEGVRPIPLDGVLKIKREGRKKVRVIIKGFHLVDGRDYNETFAGAPDLTVIKLILAIVGVKDWELH